MLFATMYSFRTPITEESMKRFLTLFAQWKIPKDLDRKAHYGFVDGSGGVLITESPSAEAMMAAAAPWQPWLEMRTVPILEIEKLVPIVAAGHAWRDSIK